MLGSHQFCLVGSYTLEPLILCALLSNKMLEESFIMAERLSWEGDLAIFGCSSEDVEGMLVVFSSTARSEKILIRFWTPIR